MKRQDITHEITKDLHVDINACKNRNGNLTVNRYSQLIQWKDGPEIVNGSRCVIKSSFTESLILFWANSMEFTIAKNELRGL